MFNYENPLTDEDLDVRNMAEAAYTLKLCNETYFSIFYQGQEMLKELARLDAEIYEQKYNLIEPYLPSPSSDTSTSTDPGKVYLGTDDAPKVIPPVLPNTIPKRILAALEYLDEQKALFNEIFQADLAKNTAELKESLRDLEDKVSKWYLKQRGAAWISGGSITLSGCTLRYSGNGVSFEYKDYDDEEDD